MLDTVLQIGKTFREAGKINQHRYVKPAPETDAKNPMIYFSIPVDKEGKIKFENKREVTSENERSEWYYLNFKTSDGDSATRTFFGDINKFLKSDGKEGGNFRSKDKSSINAASDVVKEFHHSLVSTFHNQLIQNIKKIEELISSKNRVYLHFDFSGRNWYELDNVFDQISDFMARKFSTRANLSDPDCRVFDKILYRSICSGDQKNDIQFPEFSNGKKYRSAKFTTSQISDLFYGIDYTEKSTWSFGKKLYSVVLPRAGTGKSINADSLIQFKNREMLESVLRSNTTSNGQNSKLDESFIPFLLYTPKEIVSFDTLFVQRGSNTKTDVVEISGLEKSLLQFFADNVYMKKSEVIETAKRSNIDLSKRKLTIFECLKRILADNTKDKKKYQSHLLKILPQIYTGTYYRDDVLLTAFLEKVQYNIRNEFNYDHFNYLKYDYYFLVAIRNGKMYTLEEMFNSPSYKIGKFLGEMAKPLAQKIAAFEKNYVGQLSRRASNLDDLIEFANFINQKLIIHKAACRSHKDKYAEIVKLINQLSDSDRYNKNYYTFGFFEGYYSRFSQTEIDKSKDVVVAYN